METEILFDDEKKMYYTNEGILKGILAHTKFGTASSSSSKSNNYKSSDKPVEDNTNVAQETKENKPDVSKYDINTNFQITKDFSYKEFVYSNTAEKYGIKNVPNKEELENIIKLVKTVIQPIRDRYGKPIKINSGFRCNELNSHKDIKGAANSDHRFGAAADIKAADGNNRELFNVIVKMIRNGEIKCRQLLWEYGTRSAPRWVHVSINHSKNRQKNNEILSIGIKPPLTF